MVQAVKEDLYYPEWMEGEWNATDRFAARVGRTGKIRRQLSVA